MVAGTGLGNSRKSGCSNKDGSAGERGAELSSGALYSGELTGGLYSELEYPWKGLPGDIDLDLEREVGTHDREELGGLKPGKNVGVGGKDGVDEANGAPTESEEPAKPGQDLFGSEDLKCSKSRSLGILKASFAEEELSESSKIFLDLRKSAHPGFARAWRATGLRTPELGGIRSQISGSLPLPEPGGQG